MLKDTKIQFEFEQHRSYFLRTFMHEKVHQFKVLCMYKQPRSIPGVSVPSKLWFISHSTTRGEAPFNFPGGGFTS